MRAGFARASRGLLAGAFCALSALGAQASSFYEGKQISLIVANAPGGGYDANARVLARYMSRYIPGNPTIIVKNMPGAGGLVAANNMFSREAPDGLTIALLSRSTPLQPLMGVDAARFKPEEFTWLGTASSYADNAYFLISMAGTPYKNVAALKDSGKPAQFGGLAAGGTDTDIVLLAKEVLKFNINLVRGYKASADIGIAMERGEIDGRSIGWAALQLGSYANYVKEGKLNFLVQFGRETRWPKMPDVPTARELAPTPEDKALIELVEFPLQITYPFVAPPGVPADRAKILQTAFMQTFKDPEYLAEAQKLGFDVSPLDGEKVLSMLKRVSQTPPAVVQRYKDLLEPPK
jgi:tripartite-type tricarboxylate transporter receptor subunit TctC